MRRLVLAGLRAYGRKLLLVGVATLVGTAFLAATLIVSDTLRANVERTVVGGAARLDVVVATSNRLVPLSDDILDRVRAVQGVRSAEGLVKGDVTVLGPSGRPLNDVPVGFSVTARTDVVAGRMPGSDGEVLLAEQTADLMGSGVGARVTLLDARSGQPREYVVSGLAGVAGQGDLALRGGVGLTASAASTVTGGSGFSEIHVRGDDPEALRASVAAVLGDGPFTAVTGRQYAEAQAAGSGLDPAVLATGLTMFALVALLVAGFVIQNTFRILVGRRIRELALARCMGASRSQVFAAVLVEAALVGVVASLLGSAAGVLAARALLPLVTVSGAAIPADVVTVSPMSVLVAFAAGSLATAAAAVLPASIATRVPPVAALRQAVGIPASAVPVRRIVFGLALGLAGVSCAVIALISDGRLYPLVLVGLGGCLFFGGVVLLGPVIVGPLARVVGLPFARLLGAPGRLAVANAVRNPTRAATTVLALVIGIGLTTGVSVITRSLESSVTVGAAQAVPADYLISPPGTGPDSVIDPVVYDTLRSRPEVSAVTRVRESGVLAGGDPTQLSTIAGALTPTIVTGAPAPWGSGDLALRPERAAELGVGVGDMVEIVVAERSVPMTVVALITGETVPRMVVGEDYFDTLFPGRGDAAVLVSFAAGVAPDASRAIVDQATTQDPTARVLSTYDARERVATNLGQATALVSALLGLAVLISLIGVTNTLTLSVLERTQESAMLRALGLSASGLRRMFTAEALVFGLVGGLVGTALGAGFGAVAAQVINSRVVVTVPWDLIGMLVVGAGLAAVLASVLPARQATRVPVVAALAHD